jgi:malonyl-CoA O-methyltransferase
LRFDQAARSFHSASFIHDEARQRLLERLEHLKVGSGTFVDLGAALGQTAAELERQFPDARVVALDTSLPMLENCVAGEFTRMVADASMLPFASGSIDLLVANMVLPWMQPETLFAEARRVLKPDGLLLFSTLGPDSLIELRRAWARADDAIHVHAFFDVQMLGDLVVRAGLEEPVLDVDRLRVSYGELSTAIRDLRACGATNTAAGRRRGLTGRGRWQRFAEALWQDRNEGGQGRLSLTIELIFGQAFGARRPAGAGPGSEVVVPVEALGRRGHRPER